MMSRTVFMETTKIAPGRTAAQIQAVLARYQATGERAALIAAWEAWQQAVAKRADQ